MHMQHVVPTIVVSRPGVMQQALRTALSVYPTIAVLCSTGDGLTALKQIEAQRPKLVVIGANLLPEECEALIAAVKAGREPARCLLFVQSSWHEARRLAAGADTVLLHDTPADELRAVLVRLTAPES